jgi:hypothetical protein
MAEVIVPICRIVNLSKYVFTSCKVISDYRLAVGTSSGLLLVYDLDNQDGLIVYFIVIDYPYLVSQKQLTPTFEIGDVGKFQDFVVVNKENLVFLTGKGFSFMNLYLFIYRAKFSVV